MKLRKGGENEARLLSLGMGSDTIWNMAWMDVSAGDLGAREASYRHGIEVEEGML